MKQLIQKHTTIWTYSLAFGLVLVLAACASKSGSGRATANHVPIEDRGSMAQKVGPVAAAQVVLRVQAMPGSENAGKPGYYTVKPGDTLIRIGLDNGQNWRDIARWNQLDRPSQIEIGQVLRVTAPLAPPAVTAAATANTPAAIAPIAVAMPVPMPGATTNPTITNPAITNPTIAATKPAADDLNWIWPTPANNNLLAGFDESKNKGLDIGGKLGDSVMAAADGRVVYAGSGLRGYGNLIIIKHNETFLSAYAHNQTLLVKEDQNVSKGQKIAEMGQSDSDKVKLHFEIRRQGKPVDPAQYLPKR